MKTFNISIDIFDDITGLDAVSLVEYPAVQYNFLKFSNNELTMMSFKDEEKHIITGVSLLADVPILRISPEGEKYQVVFTKDVIRTLVEKYFTENKVNSVNIEHSGDLVPDITLIESYIIDKERGICPTEFSDVTDGSWITSYKVNNPEIWNKIKSGEVKGFSVEGIFEIIEKHNFSTMKKKSIKESLKALLMTFSQIESDKGVLTYEEEGDLQVGYKVYLEDGSPAPDDEYVANDQVIVVAEGQVTEIRPIQEAPVAEEMEEAPEYVAKADFDELKAAFDALKVQFEEMMKELTEIKVNLNEVKADPVEEEFNAIPETPVYSDKLSRTLKAVSALRK